MSKRLSGLVPLEGDQYLASSPGSHASLSASAGTGKTHVLTARVLRLLLSGVDPASILCLTFTKAGAAEMADRIHLRLARWVRLKDADLGAELAALGEEPGQKARDRARTLFAEVLDAVGGGLRIQTIHAFAQSLLGSFPAEADLIPGFRPLEGREEQLLVRRVLADALVDAERSADHRFIADLQILSHRLGEGGAEAFLMRCAKAPEGLEQLGAREGIETRLRREFGLPSGDIEQAIEALCCDEALDIAGLRRIASLNAQWGGRNGSERADLCARWLASSPPDRARLLDELHGVWARKDGEIRSFSRGQAPSGDDYPVHATAAFLWCGALLAIRRTAAVVASIAAGLRAGQTFARAYVAAKQAGGLVDFDDLIRSAEQLLRTPGMGDWVRYKLDQSTDHILVDEAQDTNQRQWNIVGALTEEFFAGEGASRLPRTIFTVGDYKQAIFGFQGTNPDSFNKARKQFSDAASAIDQTFLDLSMDLSFRSSPPVLTLVDTVLQQLGPEALGLPGAPNPHQSHHKDRAGSVTMWEPFTEEEVGEEGAGGEEEWISDTVRNYAKKLARQVRTWLDTPFVVRSQNRPLQPQDILILVRRRSELAALIVARLHAEGVPVAGIDRLLLSAPLAVQDLLAAVRFAVQPLDDLNLASLLVSPLMGWSQDDLFRVAHGRKGTLWAQLREDGSPLAAEALTLLGDLLAMADYATPHQFLETMLSGPLDGRRKVLHRLGPEARDPIEELLSSALEFEAVAAPSLQRFLDWFAKGDVEIVRDPGAPLGAVRVMTVHGSKGLQAPLVVLADACGDPDRRGGGAGAMFASMRLAGEDQDIPVLRPRKAELAEPLKSQIERQEQRERQEHWRLLYVALTRAEERLFIGGALGPADRNGPPPESWYAAVARALEDLGCEWQEDILWGRSASLGNAILPVPLAVTEEQEVAILPDWLARPAPAETRPPRPLVPSALGDDLPDPPPDSAMRVAAERGRLLHQLFERMPAVEASAREGLAEQWLEHAAGVADAATRRQLIGDARTIIEHPDFADIFSPEALSEAPIAAVTPDGSVITGTVDRLLIDEERIRIVDFKTGRLVPASPEAVPVPHLRQMAAYVAALQVVFPGRPVEAALLYTSGPVLLRLAPELLDAYRPGLLVEG